ncbi:hypothetical protein BKA63DRAFT_536025 [Paraphoma chrysanthemicola]|nr:hypothetical protein BKA63DRAFT_536025 [Paraphoma chrysanthemicola]
MDVTQSFTYSAQPSRVIFGAGKINTLPAELARRSLNTPLILTNRGKATRHTPTNITNEALEYTKTVSADVIISIGGGSTIGLSKAIATRTDLPHLYGVKTTRKDPKILPGTVIYDVDLTMSLSVAISTTSGFNAIPHAVEALYADNSNPVISLLAIDGIAALAKSLPIIVASPSSVAARSSALYGAWLCGLSLGSVDMALHHKLCHAVAGSFDIPHAETHTCVLPHALAYNVPSIPKVMEQLAKVLPDSNGDAIHGLNALLEDLKNVGHAADIAVSNSYYKPREIDRDFINELIRRACMGEDAHADM